MPAKLQQPAHPPHGTVQRQSGAVGGDGAASPPPRSGPTAVQAPAASDADLSNALTAARARGAAVIGALLADDSMLSTSAMARLLGMSEEGVRHKRERHEILGIEFAKRGIRYPAWQVLPDRKLLPSLPRLFEILGDDPWRLLRFLTQVHCETGGESALDALKRGDIANVTAAAENATLGAFS